MPSLVWFRRDLRVKDNSALFHAAKTSTDGVIGLFVVTPQQWLSHDDAAGKIKFWLNSLKALSEELKILNIPLVVKTCASFAETPEIVLKVAKTNQCGHLAFNSEYEVNEARRDAIVAADAQALGIQVSSFDDRVIVPPTEIKTKEGRFYSVFTPFRKVWDTRALEFAKVLPKPKPQMEVSVKTSKIPNSVEGFDFKDFRDDLWPAGETEATKRLKKFAQKISAYDVDRDLPATVGTSLVSPYLNAGVVSPRQCLEVGLKTNGGTIEKEGGAKVWISELAWRDFYTQVMVNCPRVSMHHPFKLKTNGIQWRTDQDEFTKWCRGMTGYPIVDAGMRQLNRAGWMHNRLRMVTAMFLTKNLLIDWRWGERYFMKNLLDGDLSANNGGWQWSASTGTDSVPYFRIFNPFSQSKRFDVNGEFIKKMCPELKPIPASALHNPEKLSAAISKFGVDYPSFVVDYKFGRERALKAFKGLG